jgi:hypothetical protein
MNITLKTYILNGFDKDQTQQVEKTLQFISNKKQVKNETVIIDKLTINLGTNDFLIVFLDELTLNTLIHDSVSQSFFSKKEFLTNQVIIVLDDLKIRDIPEYFHLFPVFSLSSFDNSNFNEEEEWNSKANNNSQLTEILNDIVHFIIRTKYPQANSAITFYVGPFDDSTTIEYQKITRELLHRKFNIVPEVANPSAKELIDNQEYLLEMLRNSDFAIHFIGHQSIVDFPEKISPAIKINQITADFCATIDGQNLQRIIYVPAENSETSEIVEQKISQFKSNTHSLLNAELIQTPIEKLKEIVLQKIKELSAPITQSVIDENKDKEVYLIYPSEEENKIVPYCDWFKQKNITYSLSQINLDQLELLQYHQKQLTSCQGVIIYNSGNNQWLERKLSDIIKAPGWGRKHRFRFIIVCGQELTVDQLKKTQYHDIEFFKDDSLLKNNKLKELLSIK